MKALRDPDDPEFKHIAAVCSLAGKNVLEIGCGEGQLTYQYAHLPARVIALDLDFARLRQARKKQPSTAIHIHFMQANGQTVPFPSRLFDVVIFASSM